MKTTTEDTIACFLAAVEDGVRQAVADAQNGPDRLVKVVLWPDGDATVSESVSRERGPAEYYHRVPHELTVWETHTRMVRDGGDDPEDADAIAEALLEQIRGDLQESISDWVEAGNVS